MNDDALQSEEPAEHLRFWAYLSTLEQVTDAAEPELISEVLADPDQMMAQSAVTRHLDRRAGELHRGPGYEPWVEMMTRTTRGIPFLTQRLREWTLFRAITLRQAWDPDDLLATSNWLQLKTAEGSNTDTLEVLADNGRTKRIRNIARTNLQHQPPALNRKPTSTSLDYCSERPRGGSMG
ncbi:hypothetical protein AB0407_10770 [Streptomyces microflavus]|uniref:hypothetical protein n=1 Tax=Streptomyces microflavus TaxID=1919 RepID=UPI00344FA334